MMKTDRESIKAWEHLGGRANNDAYDGHKSLGLTAHTTTAVENENNCAAAATVTISNNSIECGGSSLFSLFYSVSCWETNLQDSSASCPTI
jgi:hypothetical protein